MQEKACTFDKQKWDWKRAEKFWKNWT